MALCNHTRKEVSFKIVYCGTPQGGKTSNLQYIHRKLDPHFRGDLISLQPGEDPMVPRIESLSVKAGALGAYQARFELVTAPGEAASATTREMLLRGADGIVFVADSSPGRELDNIESLQVVRQALEANFADPDAIPFIFQFNKRDIGGAMPPEEMDQGFNALAPTILSCAISGYQVFATLDQITQIVLKNFHSSAVMDPEQIKEENVASSGNIALSR